MRWITDLAELSTGRDAEPTVWLVRPDGPCAADTLRTIRPTADDLADAALRRDPLRGAERLARRLLLRALAAATLGVGPDAVAAARDVDGRPRVFAPRALHASIAGRDGWAAIAVAERPIGVDVEAAYPPHPLPLDLLAPGERGQAEAHGPAGRARRFARLWTAREAYLKATGAGLGGASKVEARLRLRGRVEVRGPQGRATAFGRRWDDLLACALVLG